MKNREKMSSMGITVEEMEEFSDKVNEISLNCNIPEDEIYDALWRLLAPKTKDLEEMSIRIQRVTRMFYNGPKLEKEW